MNARILIKLIKESKSLIANATPDQKIKLIRKIKESYKHLRSAKVKSPVLLSENTDYLPEK